jgi:hypothetical protein
VKQPGLRQLSLVLAGSFVLWGAGCRSGGNQSSSNATGYGPVAEGRALPPAPPGNAGAVSGYADSPAARRQAPAYEDDVFFERQYPPGKAIVPKRQTTLGRKPADKTGEDVFDDGSHTSTSRWPFGPRTPQTVDRQRHWPWSKQQKNGTTTTVARKGDAGNALTANGLASGARRVVATPTTETEIADRNRAPSLPLPIDDRANSNVPFDLSAVASRGNSRSGRDSAPRAVSRTAPPRSGAGVDEPTDSAGRAPAADAGIAANGLPPNEAALQQMPSEWDAEREPVRLVEPPPLHAPPIVGKAPARTDAGRGLTIPQIQICRRVNGFDDIVPLDAERLRQGQAILIYATLENFHSIATEEGYRTLTLSTLEVQRRDGRIVHHQSLGTAADVAQTPRREFFLTHLVTVPEELPPGEYIFLLSINDMLRHGRAQAQIAVRIMEDRSPRDETAGISGSATRPAGFQK